METTVGQTAPIGPGIGPGIGGAIGPGVDAGIGTRARGLSGSAMLVPFIVFYVVAFPKAGIKLFDVPITFGYVMSVALLALAGLRGRSLSIPLDRLLIYLACMAIGAWSALVVRVNGTDSVGYTISYFISLLYLPAFGLIVFSDLILDEHIHRVERALVWAVRFVMLYGILLFAFRQVTGKWIEIPYLTVNAGDLGDLDNKYIDRGGIFKLISTYNNGNIFGVSMCMLAPLYLRLENKPIFRIPLYVALFLTLSRTVWIGILFILMGRGLSNRIRPLTLISLAMGLMLGLVMVYFLLQFLGRDLSFIFDSNLGGRAYQIDAIGNAQIIPDHQTSALPEIVYAGVLTYFGYPGLILFVGHLLTPPALLRLEGTRLLSPSPASACLQGLLIYLVLAGSDAAFSYIPVMMIFWMVAGMGFWYAHKQLDGTAELGAHTG